MKLTTAFGAQDEARNQSDKSYLMTSPWFWLVQVGKFHFLSDFIEVEDLLLEDNEKLIFDCGLLLNKKIIDLLFVFIWAPIA